jgi:hypothetical protein
MSMVLYASVDLQSREALADAIEQGESIYVKSFGADELPLYNGVVCVEGTYDETKWWAEVVVRDNKIERIRV